MAISKIILNGVTQIDLTGDTVEAANLLASNTAHGADGEYVTGSIITKTSSDLIVSGATVTAPAGYYASSASESVSSMALPTSASGSSSGTSKATIGRSTSNQYINIPTGYNASAAYYTVSAVANGSAGTPTASKGSVSNHAVTVTPSVTNTEGYISGGTKTGTGVSVSASELVSGNLPITSNGNNIDVANYSTVSVNVSGSSGMNKQIYYGSATRKANSYGATSVTLTVAVSGTYKVSWTAWRGSSSGTMGTNLHVNNSAGTNQQTWSNTYGQRVELTGQQYSKNDVLTIWATSGNNSRTIEVANLIIEQTA